MLDLAMIKSTAQTSEPTPRNTKASEARNPKNDEKHDFETEFGSTSEKPEEEAKKASGAAEKPEKSPEKAGSAVSDAKAAETDAPKTEVEGSAVPENFPETDDDPEVAIADQTANPESAPETPRTGLPGEPHGQKAVEEKPSAREMPEPAVAAPGEPPKQNTSGQTIAQDQPAKRKVPAHSTAETIVMTKARLNAGQPETDKVQSAPPRDERAAPKTPEVSAQTPQKAAAALRAPGANAPGLEVNEAVHRAKTEGRSPRDIHAQPDPAKSVQTGTAAAPVLKPSLAPLQAVSKLEPVRDKIEVFSPVGGDLEGLGTVEQRAAAQTSPTGLAQVLSRAETPSMIARQMAEALQKLPDRPVEISLNPRELGRVRMNISAAEAGITVTVLAERPETLDLMRRNIDQLAREFEAIGYESINFAFAEGEANQSFSEDRKEESGGRITHLDLTTAEDTDIQTPQQTVATGVDIRL